MQTMLMLQRDTHFFKNTIITNANDNIVIGNTRTEVNEKRMT